MPTHKKSEAARANGAKSHGPVTRGVYPWSREATGPPPNVVLPTESAEDFRTLLHSYLAEYAPAGPVETELVETMVAVRWRLRRLSAIETALLGNEIERQTTHIDREFVGRGRRANADDRLASAFKSLSESNLSLALLVSYEGTLNRSHDRAFKQLQILQAARNRPQPNEPKKSLPVESLPVEPSATGLGDRARATIEVSPPINAKHLHP